PPAGRAPRGRTPPAPGPPRTSGRSPNHGISWTADVPEPGTRIEDLLRDLAPQVLGALARRYGHFDLAEDAVQEALLAAASQWPSDGIPASPRGWLITLAARRLTHLFPSHQPTPPP